MLYERIISPFEKSWNYLCPCENRTTSVSLFQLIKREVDWMVTWISFLWFQEGILFRRIGSLIEGARFMQGDLQLLNNRSS